MWKLKKCGGGLYSVLFRNKISFYIQPGAKNHPRKQRGKEEWIGPTENANEVNFPEALAKLTFGHDFNQSLLADDFGCLWNSCEFVCRIWPLGCEHWFVPRDICRWSDDHICLPRATKSTTLYSTGFESCWSHAISGLKHARLPKKLRALTFGHDFNQRLETLPEGLQSLTFGHNFDQPLAAVSLGVEKNSAKNMWTLQHFP